MTPQTLRHYGEHREVRAHRLVLPGRWCQLNTGFLMGQYLVMGASWCSRIDPIFTVPSDRGQTGWPSHLLLWIHTTRLHARRCWADDWGPIAVPTVCLLPGPHHHSDNNNQQQQHQKMGRRWKDGTKKKKKKKEKKEKKKKDRKKENERRKRRK